MDADELMDGDACTLGHDEDNIYITAQVSVICRCSCGFVLRNIV